MSNTPNFRSNSPTFLVNSSVGKSPRFVFVSIHNPRDIKDPKKQKIIRRHARKDIERNKRRENKIGVVLSSNLAETATETIKSTLAGALSLAKEEGTHEDQQHVTGRVLNDDQAGSAYLQIPSLDFLSPIGAGRGFNPFAPLPIKATPRTVQLLDYRIQPFLSSV
jgi:hypothetical protein